MRIATHVKLLPSALAALCLAVFFVTGTATAATRPDSWQPAGTLGTGRALPTATTLADGRVLVAGGQTGLPLTATGSAELYDPSTMSWTPTGAMNVARAGQTATLLHSDKVLIVGGASGTNLAVAAR